MCSFNQETCVVTVNSEETLYSIHVRLSNRWIELKDLCIRLVYSLPGYCKCMLRCDDDVRSLVTVADSFNAKRVDVEVIGDGNIGSTASYTAGNSMLVGYSPIDNENYLSQCLLSSSNKDDDSAGWDKLIVKAGQRFYGGVIEFRECLQKLSIDTGFHYVYTKNHSDRITAVCAMNDELNCGWMVHAVKETSNDCFCIKKLCNVHICGTSSRFFGVSRMSSKLAAKMIIDLIRDNPSTSPTEVMHFIKSHKKYEVSYDIAFEALRKARDSLYGDIRKSFRSLPAYVDSVKRTNPGSIVFVEVDPESRRFRRMFVAFDACICGFSFCRPMLFVDGAHLKSGMNGHLLAATGKDGDNGLFPLCYAVVDSENEDNWHWFLTHLKRILIPPRRMTFMTDRNPGLLKALPEVFRDAYHSYCIYHLQLNIRSCFSGRRGSKGLRDRMVQLLLKCAFASTVQEYNKHMDSMLRDGGEEAANFFKNLKPENWANAYFQGDRYGHTASAAAESFNAWVFKERHLPVLNMVDGIRIKIMKQMSDRCSKCSSWSSTICPQVDAKLYELMDLGRSLTVVSATHDKFEVLSYPSASVNLEFCGCSCGEWQRNSYPCIHGVAVIRSAGLYLHDYVDVGFLTKSYVDSYKLPILPISGSYQSFDVSSDHTVLPPIGRRQPGRPRTKRIKSKGEEKHLILCGRCKQMGNHNTRTCTAPVDM